MRRGIAAGVLTLLCVVAVCGFASGIAAADHEEGIDADDGGIWIDEDRIENDDWDEHAPYVDAGLDQDVYVGDEVLLDGGGTWDDQDDVTDQEWSIETPDGQTIQPECPTCWFTSFPATQVGEYAVTLTVRDSEGFENDDTLYVRVAAPEPNTLAESAGGGGSSSGGGCWGSEHTSAGPNWCRFHADVEDEFVAEQGEFTWADHENGEAAVVFDVGHMSTGYSEYSYDGDGDVVVPRSVVREEGGGVFDDFLERVDVGTTQAGNLNEGNDGLSPEEDFRIQLGITAMSYGDDSGSSSSGTTDNNDDSIPSAVEAMSYDGGSNSSSDSSSSSSSSESHSGAGIL